MGDNNQIAAQDSYGHFPPLTGTALAAGGTATAAAAGSITITGSGLTAGGSGSLAFTAVQSAVDLAGSFQVTAGGTPAAGTVATITFANPLPGLPRAILATMGDTDGDQNDALLPTAVTCQGFSLVTDLSAVAAELYNVNYLVVC